MSQVNAAMGQPAAPLPSGTAPAVAPPAAATPPAPVSEDDVRIPRGSLGEWDGSWHAAVEAGNKFRALGPMGDLATELLAGNYSPEDIRAIVLRAQNAGEMPAPTPPQSLTREEFQAGLQEMKQSFGQTLQEREAANEQRTRQEADIHTAQENEVTFRTKTVEGLGYKLKHEDGTEDRVGSIIRREFDHALNAVLQEEQPEGLDEQARQNYYAMPTQEHLDKAAGNVAHLKDLKIEMAASVAEAQEQTPTATLGAGPAAVQAPPKFEDMSPEDRVAAITQDVDIARPDDKPES